MNSGRFISNLLLLVFLASQVTLAQVTTGTILGTVTDSTGAVIPGATINIRNVETGIARSVASDAEGRFRVPQLGLGSYEVVAEAPGFQSVVRSGITLTVGREAVVDFTLQVGAVAERITVTGEAPLIETTNSTVATLVDQSAMQSLPLLGRSFADLTSLQPGVIADIPITASVFTAGGGSTRRSIGGMRPQQSNYLLDGLEIATPSSGMPVASALGEQLGVDSIREYSVTQSGYGANYGRAAGGVVNAVTQSGTNEFHGGVFENFRNSALDAQPYYFGTSAQVPKPALRRNQFGAYLGGPLQKDRTFFFMDYEAVRQSQGSQTISQVQSPETRTGQITGCAVGADGRRPARCSPSDRIILRKVTVNENVKFFIDPKLLPLPNGDYGPTNGAADYLRNTNYTAEENYGIARIDRQLTSSDSLFGRLTIDRSSRVDFGEYKFPDGTNDQNQTARYAVAAISETHIFSPTVLNTFRVGFTRRNDRLFGRYTEGGDLFPPDKHPNMDPRFSAIPPMPLTSWGVPNALDMNIGLGGPAWFVDNTFDYDDQVNINTGRHAITTGGNLRWYQTNGDNEPWQYGAWSWNTIDNFLTNKPFRNTVLLRLDTPGSLKADTFRGWRQRYGALFIQDDFRLLPNLTLNLGVRWEHLTSPQEVNGKLAQLNDADFFKASGFTLLTKEDGLFDIRYVFKGLSPRLGFAWTPLANQKTVVRGGFGAFPELPMAYIYGLGIEAPPYNKRYVLSSSQLKFPFPFSDPSILKSDTQGPLLTENSLKTAMSYQWTLTVEQQVRSGLVVKTNYIGSRGNNLFNLYNPNSQIPVIKDGRPYVGPDFPLQNKNFNSFRMISNTGEQWYHAGQFVVENRFSGGLRFNGSYTWSKNLDTGTSGGIKCAEQLSGTSGLAVYNNHDMNMQKGPSGLNVKHNFILTGTYEMPFGTGRRWGSQWNGVVDRILGGWTISGSNSMRSGLPVDINISGSGQRTFCRAETTICVERPDLIPGGNNNPVLENWNTDRYYDTSQFVLNPIGFFGTTGRNTLTRPGLWNLNVSLAKTVSITEGKRLDIRGELFNFTNSPNFGPPGASVFDSRFDRNDDAGRITTTANPMRRIQLSMKLTF
ncbi:MAG: TonB-dependent receptor [Acidobacteria bacterium]|nr:TonB-dependent receptor [Acidobacteriota bacterium]